MLRCWSSLKNYATVLGGMMKTVEALATIGYHDHRMHLSHIICFLHCEAKFDRNSMNVGITAI